MNVPITGVVAATFGIKCHEYLNTRDRGQHETASTCNHETCSETSCCLLSVAMFSEFHVSNALFSDLSADRVRVRHVSDAPCPFSFSIPFPIWNRGGTLPPVGQQQRFPSCGHRAILWLHLSVAWSVIGLEVLASSSRQTWCEQLWLKFKWKWVKWHCKNCVFANIRPLH